MIQILEGTRIPFMRFRRYAYMFSLAVMAIGVVALIMNGGLNLGVDFTGGRLIEYRFNQRLNAEDLRRAADQAGVAGVEVQEAGSHGTDFLLRLPVEQQERPAGGMGPSESIRDAVEQSHPGVKGELLREEVVGPKVGRELRSKAAIAILISLAGILLYVGWRYEFTYALAGVAALAHVVIVAVLLLAVFNKEITVQIIAALLAIGGYSINDTVVVFDRIREQSRIGGKRTLEETMDNALNETLSRTLITSSGTIYALAALFFLGGEVIHDFAFTMLAGVLFGTYSSIYVATALALELGNSRDRRARMKAAAVKA